MRVDWLNVDAQWMDGNGFVIKECQNVNSEAFMSFYIFLSILLWMFMYNAYFI